MGLRSQKKLRKRIVEGRVSTLPPDEPWTSFQRAYTDSGESRCFDGTNWFDVYRNSRYTVMMRVIPSSDSTLPEVVHLSIKRNDKAPLTKWRDLQKIKNDLVGPECEAIQLFPAESRLVDTANQVQLYVFNSTEFRVPFGYRDRLVAEGNYRGGCSGTV